MTDQQLIEEVARIDGWIIIDDNAKHEIHTLNKWTYKGRTIPKYLESHDATLPVVQKVCWESMDTAIKFENQLRLLYGVVRPLPALTTKPREIAIALVKAVREA